MTRRVVFREDGENFDRGQSDCNPRKLKVCNRSVRAFGRYCLSYTEVESKLPIPVSA